MTESTTLGQAHRRRAMPAINIKVVFLMNGLGLAAYVLAAFLFMSEAIGEDGSGTLRVAFFSFLGVAAGVHASFRLVSALWRDRLAVTLLASLMLLGFALWSVSLGLHVGLVHQAGIAAARSLGGGFLSVAVLECILSAWLFFPPFLFQGALAGLLLFKDEANAANKADLVAFLALGAAGCGLFTWLFLPSLPMLELTGMIACMVAALLSWMRIRTGEGENSAAKAGTSKNQTETVTPILTIFGFGLAATIVWCVGDWMLGLFIGPAPRIGLTTGLFFAGFALGLWLGGGFGDEKRSPRIAVGACLIACAAVTIVSLVLYGPLLALKSTVLEWTKFRGADFHAPFFSAYVLFAGILLVSLFAAVSGRLLFSLLADEGTEWRVAKHPAQSILVASAGAIFGMLLMSDFGLPLLGVKSALMCLFAAALLCCACLCLGRKGARERLDQCAGLMATAAILPPTVLASIFPLSYAIAVGIACVTIAYALPCIDSCIRSEGRRKSSIKLIGATLALAGALSGPVDQGNHLLFFDSSTNTRTGSEAELIYRHQGRATNIQVFSDNTYALDMTLVVNGIERDAYNRYGTLSPQEEPAILTAVLPALYRPEGGRIAVTGLGLGTTTRAVLSFGATKRLETIEKERATVESVFRSLRDHVLENVKAPPPENLSFLDDSRHVLVHQNPAAYLSVQMPRSYDIIISSAADPADPSDYSEFGGKFYSQVSGALNEEGVFVQRIRMRSISDRELATLIVAISDELGEYALYTSRGELIVVAAKRNRALPAVSGYALRRLDVGSVAFIAGFRDREHVLAHWLGGKKLFDAYFRGLARDNTFDGGGGSLFGENGFSLLASLNRLDFPLVAIKSGTELPEIRPAEDRLRYAWEGLRFAYAMSIYRHYVEGEPNAHRFRRSDFELFTRILEGDVCPDSLEGWLDLLTDLRVAMRILNPYLHADKMAIFWEEINKGCLGSKHFPEGIATFIDYYRALSERNFRAVLRHGVEILESGREASEMASGVLAALILGGQVEGYRIESMELLTQYLPYLNRSDAELMRFASSGLFEEPRSPAELGGAKENAERT